MTIELPQAGAGMESDYAMAGATDADDDDRHRGGKQAENPTFSPLVLHNGAESWETPR